MEIKTNRICGWAYLDERNKGSTESMGYFELDVPAEFSEVPEKLQELADRGLPVPVDIIERAIREREEAKAFAAQRICQVQAGEPSEPQQ